ncbi:hypothetical protein, partial [Clostridium sp. Cult3]|uniref:hypothetical protein n=1 Tax=Clostridium sp. Cult3 TaxID=2079004 RepID=UPI001F2AE6A2
NIWGGVVDRVNKDLYELCSRFLQLLELSKEKGIISDSEYELHVKLKQLFIHQEKNKLSK